MNRAARTTEGSGERVPFSSRRGEEGQSLVEAALVSVILLLLLGAIIDVGRAFSTYIALQNGAGEGAYYAAGFPGRITSDAKADPDNVEYRTMHESPDSTIDWSRATISVTFTPDRSPSPPRRGDLVTVTVRYQFETIGPLTALLGWEDTFVLEASASQQVISTEP